MPDDNGQVPVLNPAETEAWIRHISNRIAKGVKVTTDAEADMKAKKRAFDLAYAYAYKRAEGSEQFRKQTAVIESMPHREEADNAEIAYRYAQRTAEALERELFAAMAVNRNIVSMFGAAGGGVVTDEEIAAQIVRRLAAQQRLIRAVEVLKDGKLALNGISDAVDDMELAARDLTNVIDDSPHSERPPGWETSPDGVTA